MDLDSMAVGGKQVVIDTPYVNSTLPLSLRFTNQPTTSPTTASHG